MANNKTFDNNYKCDNNSNKDISLKRRNEMLADNNTKDSYMNGKIKIINLYDSNNNYDNDNNHLRKSTSSHYSNITNINFDSIRNRYKLFNFLQKQKDRHSGDNSNDSISQEKTIKKQKSVMANSRYANRNNNDIKKSNTSKLINYNNNCKNNNSNYNSNYNNRINKSINISEIQNPNRYSKNTIHINQNKNKKEIIETNKTKYTCLGELKDKKQKCICGCEDNLDKSKFYHSPDYKFYQIEKQKSYNNLNNNNSNNIIIRNRSSINDKKEKYNFNKNEKEKNNYYINIKSIELKEGLQRKKNNELYYSKYSTTNHKI